MKADHKIHIALLDEGVNVWRPVDAEHRGGDTYYIVSQPYDRNVESWEFEPGDEVICEVVQSSEGPILAAVRRAGVPL